MPAAQLAAVPAAEVPERRRPGRPRKPSPPPPPRPRRKHGTGSIVVKGERVYALDVRDEAGHRATHEPIGGTVDERYALCEAWLAEQIASRKRLAGVAPETVRDYLGRWLVQTYSSAPITTFRVHQTALRQAQPIYGLLVSELTPEAINTVTDKMLAAGMSNRYCLQIRSTLRSAFARLVPKVLDRNPVGQFSRPLTVPKRRPKAWDESDAQAFVAEGFRHRWGAMWLLATFYGPRGGELRALQWPDVDRRASTILIRRGLRPGRRIGDTKTHAERTIEIVPEALAALLAHAETRYSSPLWVFAREDGEPMTREEFVGEYRAIIAAVNERREQAALEAGLAPHLAAQAGLLDFTPHGLRHTAATCMLRRGVAIAKVSEILGHHSPAFTYGMYGWAVPSDQKVVTAAVRAMLGPLGEFLLSSTGMAAGRQHGEV